MLSNLSCKTFLERDKKAMGYNSARYLAKVIVTLDNHIADGESFSRAIDDVQTSWKTEKINKTAGHHQHNFRLPILVKLPF